MQAAVDSASDFEVVLFTIVSGGSSGVQKIFVYREHCVEDSVVPKAILHGECSQTGLLEVKSDLFLDVKLWNFHGCPLLLFSRQEPPYQVLRLRPAGGFSFSGVHAVLLSAVGQRLNATLDVREGTSADRVKLWEKPGEFAQNPHKVLFDVLPRFYTLERHMEMNPSYMIVHFNFFVPSHLGVRPGPFASVFREFSPTVWVAGGISYVAFLAVLSRTWWGEHPVQNAGLFMLSSLLGNVLTNALPNTTRNRTLMAFWLMFSIVSGTAYLAALQGLVAVPPQAREISSMQELLKSKLTIVGDELTVRGLKQQAENQGDAILRVLSARIQTVPDIRKAVHMMVTERDTAVYYERNAFFATVAHLEKACDCQLVHEIPDRTGSNILLSYFVTRRGSRLQPVILDVLTRALDAGLFTKILRDIHFRRPGKAKKRWSQVRLANLRAVYMLLLIGLALGGLTFTTELLLSKLSK